MRPASLDSEERRALRSDSRGLQTDSSPACRTALYLDMGGSSTPANRKRRCAVRDYGRCCDDHIYDSGAAYLVFCVINIIFKKTAYLPKICISFFWLIMR